ncbi:nucleoplasmin-like protein ANO39 isoform X1 [Synchiropus splendidus]|uniref:nucleoplasmin-like protein ANO39 isoform X1 n=1 Tax=Synchiropus splendidus TaxID=270530 RepID=UPI00237DA73D|nr:nucleoplasmin-like protein ANO39 isoform X1 [Synchiropus splendidus]
MPRKKKAVDAAAPTVGVTEDARSAEEEERVLLENVRAFAHQRLSAAVEEIFLFFQNSICDYEANLDKYGRLLDSVLQPELRLHRVDGEAPSARLLTGASQENSSSEDEEDEEEEDEEGDETNDKEGDEDEDDDEGASGREEGDEGDVGEEDHESDAPSPEEENGAMDDQEVHEMKALQPELSMKPGEKKPRIKVRPPEPRRTKKTAKSDATELLGRLKLEGLKSKPRSSSVCEPNTVLSSLEGETRQLMATELFWRRWA